MPDKENQDQQFHFVHEYTRIPKVFHSDATGEPMKHCIMCEAYLFELGTPYVIEKAFRYYPGHDLHDTIFEYAICFDCYNKMSVTLSEQSKQKLQEYFSQVNNLEARRQSLMQNDELSVDDWIDHCAIKGTDIKESSEYQVCCQCDGPNMLFTHLPIALSEEALEEVTELLSPETKDELDRFQDDFLGIPPELKELFKDRRPVMV